MKVVFFDGRCGFCSSFVRFVWKRDREGAIFFAAIQSETGRRMLAEAGVPSPNMETMYFISEKALLDRSSAVLGVFGELPRYRTLAFFGRMVPRLLRDRIYLLVARNRHRLPGDQCELPPVEVVERFLDRDDQGDKSLALGAGKFESREAKVD